MSRQITILIMIDTEAALADGTLENNIYLMDSERMEGSQGHGTETLVTSVINGTLADGSQNEDIVLNWCVGAIQTLPPSLPRFYIAHKQEKLRSEAITALKNGVADGKLLARLKSLEDLGMDTLPHLADITGEAVDGGIIFPAQYGTPVPVHGGWYWSASVSTYRPETYSYVLHLELYKMNGEKWEAIRMTHEAAIRIENAPQRNGFTGAGRGFLPVYPTPNVQPQEEETI